MRWRLSSTANARFDSSERRVDAKYDSFERKMDAGFEKLIEKMDARFDPAARSLEMTHSDTHNLDVRVTKIEK